MHFNFWNTGCPKRQDPFLKLHISFYIQSTNSNYMTILSFPLLVRGEAKIWSVSWEKVNIPGLITIEGFHQMSYQANFVSHHVHDCHVGFLSARSGFGKYNKMRPVLTKWATSRKISFPSYNQIHIVQTLSFKMIYHMSWLLPYLGSKTFFPWEIPLFLIDFWNVQWAISPLVPWRLVAHFVGTGHKCPVTFYLVHTTIANYNWVTRKHTYSVEIWFFSMK